MNQAEFQNHLGSNAKPIIVDLWAPWCGPCRAMEPAFKQAAQKYYGQVDVLKINADESPDVLKSLGVMGIPTVVGFFNGKEVIRRSGMQSAEALDVIFDATLHQRKSVITPPAPIDRIIRSVSGLAIMVFSLFYGQSILLIGIGGILLFSAFYDRCPIYKAIVPRLATIFQKSK
jgi:thioredoxin